MVKQCRKGYYTLSQSEQTFLQTDHLYKAIRRVSWLAEGAVQSQTICTRSHNENSAKTTNNHSIKLKNGKYFIIESILQDMSNLEVVFLGRKFLQVKPLPLYDENVDWQKKMIEERMNLKTLYEFDYVFTYSHLSPSLTKLDANTFLELVTYVSVNNKNYILEIFNKHM